jgi:PAS domain S-box-containing protein
MSTTPIFDEHELPPLPSFAGVRNTTNMPASFDALPTPIIDCDRNGVMISLNLAAQNLEQAHGIVFLGREIWTLVAPEHRPGNKSSFFIMMERGGEEPPRIRRSLDMPNGGFRTYQISRAFLRDQQGQIAGLRMVLSDVTEHAAAHQREKTARLWLESVTDALAEAVIVTDALGFIRFANPAAALLTEWQEKELLHMTISQAIPILSYSRAEGVPFNYRLVLERRSSGIITFLTKSQRQATAAFSTAPVLDKIQGSTTGVSYVFRKPDVNV